MAGDVIDDCPMIVVRERDLCGDIHDYTWVWRPKGYCAMALGYGSLFNHSKEPNARYRRYYKAARMVFIASRTIMTGDEITVHYGDVIWFDVI